MYADDAAGADVAHAQRLLKGTWPCVRYLNDGAASVQNVILHLARL